MKSLPFRELLSRHIKEWVQEGIITEDQQKKILSRYETNKVPDKEKKSVNIRLPSILIGLAAILLCTGIILFYAANWKYMHPFLKLAQVFFLIIVVYGAAFYMLIVRKTHLVIGRILLLMGMVTFGAGIMLVAQIFHISSHPTNGVLAWAVGTLAMSFVMKEKWGYYLATGLFFIWNMWEISQYGNPNYIFVIVPFLLGYLFYKSKAITGVALSILLFIIWFYQINFHWIEALNGNESNPAIAVFILAHIPLGVIFICLGWLGDRNNIIKIPAGIGTVIGWIMISVPFFSLSWPIEFESSYLVFQQFSVIQSIEYATLIVLSFGILFYLYRQGLDYRLPALCLAYSIVLLVLPLGNISTLMASTHIGLIGFIFALLFFSYIDTNGRSIEKFLAIFLFISFLAVKGIGLFAQGVKDDQYYIAYCSGFVIFCIVCFLINQLVRFLIETEGKEYPYKINNAACAFAGYLIIYALSFKIRDTQRSVFDASTVVLVLIFLFLAIGIALYSYLWIQNSERLPIMLSAVIFVFTTLILFISGPDISWIFYSLIFNILLFIYIGTFIYYSTRINSKLLLNFAIIGFVLHVATRYVDIFWDLLSGSLLFIITGIVLFAGGWLLEKNRRKLIKQIEESID